MKIVTLVYDPAKMRPELLKKLDALLGECRTAGMIVARADAPPPIDPPRAADAPPPIDPPK